MAPVAQERQHEFFRYTTGRWLRDEEERLQERYRSFNIAELQKVAVSATASRECVYDQDWRGEL